MVTKEELEALIQESPVLYHMAEQGAWPSIKERGLLSTSALLDLYKVPEPQRRAIEVRHRPSSVPIDCDGLPRAVIRDQIPMSDAGLIRCLPAGIMPADWYRLLNGKAFFWLTKERLHRLTGAKAYRDKVHDVLEIDTRSLIAAHRQAIWLCPINSGCTKPIPHPRDESAFLRIDQYPYDVWRTKRKRGERVVELAVDYSVPDIRNHVRRVLAVRGQEVVRIIETGDR